MVPKSKIVGEKEPPVGQIVKIKERQKTYSGKVVAIGKRTDIGKRLVEIEGVEDATNEMHGKYSVTCIYVSIVHTLCTKYGLVCVHAFKILRSMSIATIWFTCTLCVGSKDADVADDAGSGNCKKQGEFCIISQCI